ncbi:hypothetical protein PV328_004462 [Microctonus aethiopoides]|uniref:RFX-type winged-helix domain-containing protein n=1 Tax=Microctonus aethiopoides TaxID=144406 RepID=A0AA39KLM7_9HYME|nr:hypothetical protein PV328_004462 [Microctonus aethiopoides]
MSSDNYERPRIAHKCQRTAGEDTGGGGGFDTRKIKKEKSDNCNENGNSSHINSGIVDVSNSGVASDVVSNVNDGNTSQREHHHHHHHQQQQQRSNASSRLSNGFHAGDLLQDIIAAKFTSSPHGLGPAAKNDNIRLMIEDSISDESKSRVQEIFLQVEQLKIEEKLLLYLKLPSSLMNPSGTVDPLRQPLNPLGNRYEIHQTIMWIKTHLEEDPDVSLPKQEVYDEYNIFCIRNSMKPLSTADFGKVMKQVYPRVRPRRLGTRGNSRYCYAGMRKRVKLHTPTLPAITGTPAGDDLEENITEEMLGAASTLIREWAESTLGHKFPTLSALARHLVDNLCVDTRSLSAVCILSASGDATFSSSKENSSNVSVTPVGGKSGKMREAQLQLQKKLQQREHIRDQKHRHLDVVPAPTNHSNKDINKNSVNNGRGSSMGKGSKKSKTSLSPQIITNSSSTNTNITNKSSTVTSNRSRKLPRSASQSSTVSPQSICDTPTRTSDESRNNGVSSRSCTPNDVVLSRDQKVCGKTSRKRASLDQTRNNSETSPEKQAKLNEIEKSETIKKEDLNLPLPKLPTISRSAKISVVPPGNLKPTKIGVTELNTPEIKEKTNGHSNVFETNIVPTQTDDSSVLTKDQLRMLQENPGFLDKNEKLCTIDADALDDYLNGGNNSQEPEEELLQYFQQSSSSSSDAEVNIAINTDTDQTSRSDKVSQLRLILQQNLKGTARSTTELTATNNNQQLLPVEKCPETLTKHEIILPLVNHQNQTNSRRRVSFETNVIEHVQEMSSNNSINTIPQSPNTRRRIFNFTPISPGPHSPINGRAASKPNSANASPFVSPRNTPVPRSRSNMANVCRSRSSQKQFSRSISCSAPFIIGKNDTFVVPTSTNESTRQLSTTPLPLMVPKSTTEVQSGGTVRLISEKTLACTSFLATDVNPQKQLLINYPSQENLQEIKNNYRKNQPADQEISELFNGVKPFTTTEHYYRSQSVPLHRMVNPTLMSPISNPQSYHTFQNNNFNHSSSSSIAPTPVPSEFNDFGSIGQSDTYLLDEVDANFISDDQQFLMEDKEISSENITKILNFLDEEDGKGLNILPEQNIHSDERLIHESGLMLDPLPNANLNIAGAISLDPATVLDPSVGESLQKIIQSKSYPNTPLPQATTGYSSSAFTEDSNGSRSYPSTPLHPLQHQDVYCESNEPMLSSPTLNSLNLRGDNGNPDAENVCRNVTDLLETNFLGDNEGDADDLDPLSNFDGLQDVESLAPLFNEVTGGNR